MSIEKPERELMLLLNESGTFELSREALFETQWAAGDVVRLYYNALSRKIELHRDRTVSSLQDNGMLPFQMSVIEDEEIPLNTTFSATHDKHLDILTLESVSKSSSYCSECGHLIISDVPKAVCDYCADLLEGVTNCAICNRLIPNCGSELSLCNRCENIIEQHLKNRE